MDLLDQLRAGDAASLIPTPALVVDLDAAERNIAAMAAFAQAHRLRLRPHAKTHKSAALVHLQCAAGAVGVCVQTLHEARALLDAPTQPGEAARDVFISNEIVDPRKLAQLAALAQQHREARLSIAVDSPQGIDLLAEALRKADALERVGVLVEVDVGQGRCGVPPAQAGRLARQVVSHGLRFLGLQAYHGKAQHLQAVSARAQASQQAARLARAAQASVTAAGVACPLVTGGGTGTFAFDAESGVYNEIQPGSYLFMDADYERLEQPGGAPRFEPALFVKSQVISRGMAHVVVDAGHKAHAIESGMPRVWERLLVYRNAGDEHGLLEMPHGHAPAQPAGTPSANDELPRIGETVWLVPGHCDPTVNLHARMVWVRGGLVDGIVERIAPVDARGC